MELPGGRPPAWLSGWHRAPWSPALLSEQLAGRHRGLGQRHLFTAILTSPVPRSRRAHADTDVDPLSPRPSHARRRDKGYVTGISVDASFPRNDHRHRPYTGIPVVSGRPQGPPWARWWVFSGALGGRGRRRWTATCSLGVKPAWGRLGVWLSPHLRAWTS